MLPTKHRHICPACRGAGPWCECPTPGNIEPCDLLVPGERSEKCIKRIALATKDDMINETMKLRREAIERERQAEDAGGREVQEKVASA